MTTIVAFITARLDEDERIAQAAGSGPYARWAYAGEYDSYSGGEVYLPDVDHYSKDIYPYKVTSDNEGLSPSVGPDAGRHIARHDPARVLADVEAKRALVDYWSRAFQNPIDADKFPGHDWDLVRGAARWTLRHLATSYASHPDYQAYWAL